MPIITAADLFDLLGCPVGGMSGMLQWIALLLTVLGVVLMWAVGLSSMVDPSTHYENRKNKKKKK